jgi:ribosome recycling factor
MNILEQIIVSLGSLTEEQRRELMRRLVELGKLGSKPPPGTK